VHESSAAGFPRRTGVAASRGPFGRLWGGTSSATEMELFFRIHLIQSLDPPNMGRFRVHNHWDLSSKAVRHGNMEII